MSPGKPPDMNDQLIADTLDLDPVSSGSATPMNAAARALVPPPDPHADAPDVPPDSTPMNGAARRQARTVLVGEPIPPPHDLDAEAAVLSALLMSADEVFQKIGGIIDARHMYADANHRIFDAAAYLYEQGTAVDVTTVASRLRDTERLAQIGGTPYLAQLITTIPCVAHVDDYARTIRKHAQARELRADLLTIAAEAGAPGADVSALLLRTKETAERIDLGTKPPEPSALEAHWVKLIDRPEFLTETPPAQTWLLKQWVDGKDRGVLPRGQIGLLSADGGTGKGYAVSQLALAIATGSFWLDTFRATEPGHVLLGLAEETFAEARRRLWRIANALELSTTERREALQRIDLLAVHGVKVSLTDADADGTIFETTVADDLRKMLEGRGVDWSAIVLDPLSRWAGGRIEIDNESATRFAQVLESFTYVRGRPSGLLSHHSSKFSARSGESDSRGVSGLRNAFRWEATLDALRADDGTRGAILRNKKNNLAAQFDDVVLVRREDPGVEGVLRLATAAEAEAFGSKKAPKAAVQDDDVDARILETVRRHRVKSATKIAELTQGTTSKIFERVKALRFTEAIVSDAEGFFVLRGDGKAVAAE